MYMLYSSHFMICTVSCIPTGIYNNVHALFFSSYHNVHACVYAFFSSYIPTSFLLTYHMHSVIYLLVYMHMLHDMYSVMYTYWYIQ